MHDREFHEPHRNRRRSADPPEGEPPGLARLGADGIALLRIMPLLHVAWLVRETLGADDRRALLQTARTHGVAAGSTADRLLRGWLEERPSEDFFASCLVELKSLLADLPPAEQAASKTDLVAYMMTLDRLALDVRSRRAIVGVSRRASRERRVVPRGAAPVRRAHRPLG
ncbi:MAG: hypothetical protein AB1689_18195 [Thermodesulfobacteriota bacterium]